MVKSQVEENAESVQKKKRGYKESYIELKQWTKLELKAPFAVRNWQMKV